METSGNKIFWKSEVEGNSANECSGICEGGCDLQSMFADVKYAPGWYLFRVKKVGSPKLSGRPFCLLPCLWVGEYKHSKRSGPDIHHMCFMIKKICPYLNPGYHKGTYRLFQFLA